MKTTRPQAELRGGGGVVTRGVRGVASSELINKTPNDLSGKRTSHYLSNINLRRSILIIFDDRFN